MKYQALKGTFDILPHETKDQDRWKESCRWSYLETSMRQLASDYGYLEIRTPIFEKTELFNRGVGQSSDIISKEMYTFDDKKGRSISLRPEGTASVIRAFIENGLKQLGSPQKFFYIGPFFRYERPQEGRFRQFHQFGVEAIGDPSAEQDLEVIDMLFELFRRLGLKNLKLKLSSLGNGETRRMYKEKLLAFLKPHFPSLSPESQTRFVKNPLRILDSKAPEERALLADAPNILDLLDTESHAHFHTLCHLLEEQEIPFTIDPKLVRGLDYYNQTVFEITSEVLGSQNSVGGGGRYNQLSERLGSESFPSIGFSAGIERILQTMDKQGVSFPSSPSPLVCFIPLGECAKKRCLSILYKMRHNRVAATINFAEKMQKALQKADEWGVRFCVIIGQKEESKGVAQVKNMRKHQTGEIPIEELAPFLLKQNRNH